MPAASSWPSCSQSWGKFLSVKPSLCRFVMAVQKMTDYWWKQPLDRTKYGKPAFKYLSMNSGTLGFLKEKQKCHT